MGMIPDPLKRFLSELGTIGSVGFAAGGYYILQNSGSGNMAYVGWGVLGTGLLGLAISQGYLIG
jgi:hypothetical protein